MVRLSLMAAGLAAAIASSAQAMPVVPIHQWDTMITTVREDCGAGRHRVNGVCVATPTTRAVRRCAAGLRLVNGRCVK
jgi:hypothetical protein